MGVHWDAAFTRWWPHKEGEKVFSLAHLHPFVYTMELPAKAPHPHRVAHIRVGFSTHCFTRKWPKEGVTLGIYENDRAQRTSQTIAGLDRRTAQNTDQLQCIVEARLERNDAETAAVKA